MAEKLNPTGTREDWDRIHRLVAEQDPALAARLNSQFIEARAGENQDVLLLAFDKALSPEDRLAVDRNTRAVFGAAGIIEIRPRRPGE